MGHIGHIAPFHVDRVCHLYLVPLHARMSLHDAWRTHGGQYANRAHGKHQAMVSRCDDAMTLACCGWCARYGDLVDGDEVGSHTRPVDSHGMGSAAAIASVSPVTIADSPLTSFGCLETFTEKHTRQHDE